MAVAYAELIKDLTVQELDEMSSILHDINETLKEFPTSLDEAIEKKIKSFSDLTDKKIDHIVEVLKELEEYSLNLNENVKKQIDDVISDITTQIKSETQKKLDLCSYTLSKEKFNYPKLIALVVSCSFITSALTLGLGYLMLTKM